MLAIRLLVVLVCLLGAAWPAGAASPFDLKRLVHRYDFEDKVNGRKIARSVRIHHDFFAIGREPDISDDNFLQQPMHKDLVTLDGYPRYGEVGFDDAHFTSGEFSLHLGLRGGNTGAFIRLGSVPAVPRSDYMVTANVRSEGLTHARARLQAFFVDGDGVVIAHSITSTPLLKTEGAWQRVRVRLRGDDRRAAWIGLRIELLQPTADADGVLSKHEVVLEDVEGDAWFDDIAVWQVPRIVVRTQTPTGIVRSPLRPRLSLEVRDLTGQALQADVAVYDTAMQRVDRMRQAVGSGGPSTWVWRPKLKQYGWYLVDLVLYDVEVSRTRPIARQLASFLYLPDQSTLDASSMRRFQLDAEELPPDQLALLPDVLREAGLGSAILSVWQRGTTKASVESEQYALDRVVQRIVADDRRVRLAFDVVPEELAEKLSVPMADVFYVLRQPRELWEPYITPVFVRHGQMIRDWQLGSAAKASVFHEPQLPSAMQQVMTTMHEMAPSPTLHVPWRLDQSRVAELPGELAYALAVPHAVRPELLGEHLASWQSAPAAAMSLGLHVRPATQMSQQRRVADMTLRLLHAWEAGARDFTIEAPWTKSTTHDLALMPDPTLGVFAQVGRLLQGRSVVGRLPVGQGLEAMIFDGEAGGMLALWRTSAAAEDAGVDMYLGEQPVAVDVWGNRTQVEVVGGRHRLKVTRMPVFVEGINAELAGFRASFALVEDFIESNQKPHERKIVLSNPWDRTINGTLTLTGLKSWRISPRRTNFNIAAGGTAEIPVTLSLPITEVAGDKALDVRFDLLADKRYVIDAETHFKLGLREADFDANLTLERNATTGKVDVVVTQVITNTGDRSISIYAFANLRGFPRQERIVARLGAGESVVRRFRFPDAAATLRDSSIRVGLRETQGPAILNKVLSYDDL